MAHDAQGQAVDHQALHTMPLLVSRLASNSYGIMKYGMHKAIKASGLQVVMHANHTCGVSWMWPASLEMDPASVGWVHLVSYVVGHVIWQQMALQGWQDNHTHVLPPRASCRLLVCQLCVTDDVMIRAWVAAVSALTEWMVMWLIESHWVI